MMDMRNIQKLKVYQVLINKERIRKAKTIQETFNNENSCKKQCDTIPATIIYDMHMTPCYKKFTLLVEQNPKKHQRGHHFHHQPLL